MRFDPESSHQANAGLKVARDLLEQVKRKFLHIAYWACSLFYGLSPRLFPSRFGLYQALDSGGHGGVLSPTMILLTLDSRCFVRAKNSIVQRSTHGFHTRTFGSSPGYVPSRKCMDHWFPIVPGVVTEISQLAHLMTVFLMLQGALDT